MKEVKLPSGAVLKIGIVPFDACNELKKAVMQEVKGISIARVKDVMDVSKDYICTVFGSDAVEMKLWECMKRCTYNSGKGDLKLDKDTFEAIEARQDFTEVQIEVGMECLGPFGKSLYAVLLHLLDQAAQSSPK